MIESKKNQLRILAAILLALAVMAKMVVTGVNHWRVINAIYFYKMDCLTENREDTVDYAEMEEYDKTLWRWWDWSDRNILSCEDYAKIKPYIGQKSLSDAFQEYMQDNQDLKGVESDG